MLSQVCLVLLALLCALASVALADPARVLVACVANRAAVHNLALVARDGLLVLIAVTLIVTAATLVLSKLL